MTNREHTQPAANQGAEPIRTLIVDDSAKWIKVLCGFLKREPRIRVAGIAGDGREGIAQIERLRPALVLLDLRMPRLDGLDTAAILRARFPEVVIVMLSFDDDEASAERCLAHGAHAFIGKGRASDELLPAIFRLFGGGDTSARTVPGAAQFQSARKPKNQNEP